MKTHSEHRVVVTGMALSCATGNTLESFWERICNGPSAITSQTVADSQVNIAPCPELHSDLLGGLHITASAALQDSFLEESLKTKSAFVLGTNFGPLLQVESALEDQLRDGLPIVSTNFMHRISTKLANMLNIQGSILTCSTACASGNGAIGVGFHLVRSGRVIAALVGGYDILTTYNYRGLKALHIITPEQIRPFSANRSGTLLGEGAGFLVLENYEHAKARKANQYGEFLGYGYNNNAFHLTAPQQNGSGIAHAMTLALKDANLKPEKINYINAHGTGTIHNDFAETSAIQNTFKEYAASLAVSSIKPIIGHTMGAAGALETIATLLSLYHSIIPPTHHYQEPDSSCPLDYVIEKARIQPSLQYAMSNSYGIGGGNAILVLGKARMG